MDDINEISYNECEGYCVIVPDACVKLYVGRWFDEMTKSNNIETFFEENRNRHSNKFKTALRTYMAELEEEDIVKLIKTAGKSSDRLHKMFVTTKTDIENDSIREFERYGIVLQDKCMDMYTEIVLDSIYYIEKNRTTKSVLKCMRQFDLSKIRKLIHTLRGDAIHQMITVEIENEIELDKTFSDCQCPYAVVKDSLEIKEGPIICPASLICLYMDRMISDWSKGNLHGVFSNKNLTNHSFVHRFLDHLNLLEPSKILELVNTYYSFPIMAKSTLVLLCEQGDVHLAKWCLENHLNENPEQKHNRLCALFLLVVFNNQLEETIINAELIKIIDEKFSFRNILHIAEETILARVVKEELNASLPFIGGDKYKGVYRVDFCMYQFLVFYFASIRQMSTVLVEHADEKLLYKWFLIQESVFHEPNFNISLRDEELLTCITRVYTKMTKSEELIRYILKKDDDVIVNSVSAFVRNLKKKEIIAIFETSCSDFINKFVAIAAEGTKYHSDKESIFSFAISDDCTPFYIKRIFDHISNNEFVEGCLQDNRNKKNDIFNAKLSCYMRELTRHEVERLINEASSDFISRMFVLSEDDIKPETCLEYERYGIVLPKDLLLVYIERVFRDIQTSIYVPVNRNSENKTFRDTLHLYINSLSEDKLASLIKRAGSKFISRMYLSSSEKTKYIGFPRIESSFMFVPKKYFQICKQIFVVKGKMKRNYFPKVYEIKINSILYTISAHEDNDCDPVLIDILSKNGKENRNLKHHLIGYIDPIATGNTIEFFVKSTNDLVSKYIQRLLFDWMNGHVHDVIGNINLGNPSFQCEFITHLRNTDHEIQSKLAKTEDTNTGDLPLAVCSYVGISELAQWCLDNTADTNNDNGGNNPLYIACVQNHPDIVSLLLNHTNKAHVNDITLSLPLFSSLCAACVGGKKTIVSLLLKEDIEVNVNIRECETPLYVACENGYFDIVSILLDKKADKIKINKSCRNTPLYVACEKGHTKIVALLLNHTADKVDVNKNVYRGETSLYAACKGGYPDIVDLLLSHEISVINKSKINGVTPLFVACQEGHVEVVSTLLKPKIIEIDQCMFNGMSPLFIASLLGHTEIVKTLFERKANANICVKKKEILMQVFNKEYYVKYMKFIRKLVCKHASEHVKSYIDGKEKDWVFNSILAASPLHMGSLMGHTEIVKLLVESDSSINCFSENGSTPLFLACELGHADIVHVLLSNDADPNLDRKDGKSTLTIAKENGHIQIIEIIKSHKVD